MSGLVFVQDAQTRPLMPTSAGYARILLRKGKAERISHPVFNIIQLTSVVPEPILRPVVVKIFLYQQTAYLTLSTEHLRGTISSLSIIIDLQLFDYPDLLRSRRWRRRARSHYSSVIGRTFLRQSLAPYPSMLTVGRQMRLIATLITSLQAFIPITHLSILPMLRGDASAARISRYVESRLLRYLSQFRAPIKLVHPASLQAMLSSQLFQALQQAPISTAIQLPDLIVCFWNDSNKRDSFVSRTRAQRERQHHSHWLTHQNRSSSSIRPGQVCTFSYLGRTRTGFISAMRRDVLIVRIVVRVTLQGIQWRRLRLRAHQIRHRWPVSTIIMLPLPRFLTTSDMV